MNFTFSYSFIAFFFARKVAVGVSVVDPSQRGVRLFDEIVARDCLRETHFDLALAGELTPTSVDKTDILVCLRGPQTEYGHTACRSDRVEELIWSVAKRLGFSVKTVDTVVRPGSNSIAQIEQCFASAKLVLTTRLHGALMALKYGVPFVVVDQIDGGRKVTAVIRKLEWEHLYSSSVTEAVLHDACVRLLNDGDVPSRMSNAAALGQRLSRLALQRSVEAILGEAPRPHFGANWSPGTVT